MASRPLNCLGQQDRKASTAILRTQKISVQGAELLRQQYMAQEVFILFQGQEKLW